MTRRVSRRLLAAAVAALTVFAVVVFVPTERQSAQAVYGTGGYTAADTSPYLGMINWVDWSKYDGEANRLKLYRTRDGLEPWVQGELNWSKEDAGSLYQKDINNGGYQVRNETKIGTSTVVTTCTLSNYYENATGANSLTNPWMNIHIPGSYSKDGFDNVYQRYDQATRTGIPAGIGRAGGGRARFDVKCRADLLLADGTSTKIPINGLVFADGETMNSGEYAYVIPHKIDPAKQVDWRLLEYHRVPGDTTATYLTIGPDAAKDKIDPGLASYNPLNKTYLWEYSSLAAGLDTANALTYTVPDKITSAAYQPLSTFYASNADGAYIDMSGGFGNYIAVGVVLGVDLRDGPASYGRAGAITQPAIGGPRINETYVKSVRADAQPRATVGPGSAPYTGANGPDVDTSAAGSSDWTTLVNDDRTNGTSIAGFDDEDAFTKPLLTTAQPGDFTQKVACTAAATGTTTVSGWLDWNANGVFDAAERADATCTAGVANLTWHVTAAMLPPAASVPVYPSLIRLIATTDAPPSYGPTSVVTNGEVEDHAVTLVRPTLTVKKQIVDAAGKPIPGAPTDGFTFTATAPDTTLQQVPAPSALATANATQTTSASASALVPAGSALWPFAFTKLAPELLTQMVRPEIATTVTLTETPKAGYLSYPTPTCTTPQAAAWTHTIPLGTTGTSIEQPGTYAWPDPAKTAVTSVNAHQYQVGLTPTSVLDCTYSNQPYGQISVTAKVDASAVTPPPSIDPQLTFSGTYTCTAPTSGPYAGQSAVTGTWGPLKAGETWTSDPAKDPIFAGSSCAITQTAIGSSAQGVTSGAAPDATTGAYRWAGVAYQPTTAIASLSLAGQQIPLVTAVNTVELTPFTTLSWRKVDEAGSPLKGAEFDVWTAGASATTGDVWHEKVTDCVAGSASECTGEDRDPRAGYFTLAGVYLGEYLIQESAAPAGYILNKQQLSGKIEHTDLASGKDAGQIVNTRYAPAMLPMLPMAGGTSTLSFVLAGAALVLAALMTGAGSFARRKGGQSAQ